MVWGSAGQTETEDDDFMRLRDISENQRKEASTSLERANAAGCLGTNSINDTLHEEEPELELIDNPKPSNTKLVGNQK